MPWVEVRRRLAASWGCFPWDVDEAPSDEVQLQLKLLNIEAEHRPQS